MLVSKTRVITREKREKNKNANESTHSVIRPLVNNGHRAIKVHVNKVRYCRAGHIC